MKNEKLIIFIVMLVSFSVNIHAQSYSKVQQEVIDQIQTCLDSWWSATNEGDLNVFLSACPCDEDFAVWSTAFGAPIGIDAMTNIFALGVSAPSPDPPTIMIRPTRVKVVEDVAVIFYYINAYQVDPAAEFLNYNSAKRTTMLRKVDNHWQLFADMVVPEVEE